MLRGCRYGQVVACEENVKVTFEVSLSPCVDGACGDNGYCQEFFSGVFHYSSCKCIASKHTILTNVVFYRLPTSLWSQRGWSYKISHFLLYPAVFSSNMSHDIWMALIMWLSTDWRGYGCTDGSVADSPAEQLTAALLLTMSNLAFLPAIILSLYRHFFVEALVYFFTMFFSTVSTSVMYDTYTSYN